MPLAAGPRYLVPGLAARPKPRPDPLPTARARLEAICAAGTTATAVAAQLQPQLRALAGLFGVRDDGRPPAGQPSPALRAARVPRGR